MTTTEVITFAMNKGFKVSFTSFLDLDQVEVRVEDQHGGTTYIRLGLIALNEAETDILAPELEELIDTEIAYANFTPPV
jgi:hypothetical protein